MVPQRKGFSLAVKHHKASDCPCIKVRAKALCDQSKQFRSLNEDPRLLAGKLRQPKILRVVENRFHTFSRSIIGVPVMDGLPEARKVRHPIPSRSLTGLIPSGRQVKPPSSRWRKCYSVLSIFICLGCSSVRVRWRVADEDIAGTMPSRAARRRVT